MEWWQTTLLVVGAGALGGFANAVLAGGERYRICLPIKDGKDFELGVWGPVVIGIVASIVAYGGALNEASVKAQVVGCLLAGVGGANYLTSRIRIGNLRDASTELASNAAEDGQVIASEALAEPDDAADDQRGEGS